MNLSTKILVVDDDNYILNFITTILTNKGFEVIVATDGEQAINIFNTQKPNLILLDIMIPKLDGFTVCKTIREVDPLVPIIILTAKEKYSDKVEGLEIGADDYITKPFNRHELVARIQAVLRRHNIFINKFKDKLNKIEIDGLILNLDTKEVFLKNIQIDLSKTEFELLKTFMENPNKTLERGFLLKKIWGYNYIGETRTLDNFIRRIRKKLNSVVLDHKFIKTVHGVGYRFEPLD